MGYFYEQLEDIDNIDFDKVIEERMKHLTSDEYKQAQKMSENPVYIQGYIPHDKVISYGMMFHGFVYDDISVYKTLLENLKKSVKENPDREFKKHLTGIVKQTVREYFKRDGNITFDHLINLIDDEQWKGSVTATIDLLKESGNYSDEQILEEMILVVREHFPAFLKDKYDQNVSISFAKGLGTAKCSEFAALTQQCLAFLGIPSFYVANRMADKNGSEGHAYNVLKNDKEQYFILDVLNNISHEIENKELASALILGKANVPVKDGQYCYGATAKVEEQGLSK